MAGNFNNGNNNNRQRRMSYTFATAFSGEKSGTEYQMVKIGFYDEKLTLDFNKGVAGSNSKMTSSFVKIDYELAVILTGLLEEIIKDRVPRYRNGEPYANNVNFNYKFSYMDRESNTLKTLGNLSVVSEQTEAGRVVIVLKYSDGKDEYRIVLGSPNWVKDSFSFGEESFLAANIDVLDARLYAVTHLLKNVVCHWVVLVQNDQANRIMMNRLSAIAEKLGIPAGNGNRNDGRYNDQNYRSNRGGSGNSGSAPVAEELPPPGDDSAIGGPGDEPF